MDFFYKVREGVYVGCVRRRARVMGCMYVYTWIGSARDESRICFDERRSGIGRGLSSMYSPWPSDLESQL